MSGSAAWQRVSCAPRRGAAAGAVPVLTLRSHGLPKPTFTFPGTVKRPLSHAADEEHHDPSYYMPTGMALRALYGVGLCSHGRAGEHSAHAARRSASLSQHLTPRTCAAVIAPRH